MLDHEKIIELHQNGLSPKKIGELLGTYNTSIRRVLLKHGKTLKNQSEAQVTTNNKFLNLDNEEVQYWLGILAADGTIGNKDNLVCLGLQEKDKEHVDKYAYFIGVKTHKVHNKKYDSYEYRAYFKNKSINFYLKSIGITNSKSATLNYKLPITNHFLRGVIDGDGYIRKEKPNIEIASQSQIFTNQLIEYLKLKDIHCTTHKSASVNIIGIYKKNDVKRLYDLLYKDASVFLERKKSRLDAFFL